MSDKLIKRSAVAGKVPDVDDIELAQLAINTADGKLFMKRSVAGVESIIEVGAVQSVAGKSGVVTLVVGDVSGAAPLASPNFTGTPTAPTAATSTNNSQLATTAYVKAQGYVTAGTSPVTSVQTRTGAVVITAADIGLNLVENKSSATIRGEITSGNVTSALGFTPVNKAGDTVSGNLAVTGTLSAGGGQVWTVTSLTKLSQLTNDVGFVGSGGAPVQSVFGRTGAVVLNTTDISNTLGYTPTGEFMSITAGTASSFSLFDASSISAFSAFDTTDAPTSLIGDTKYYDGLTIRSERNTGAQLIINWNSENARPNGVFVRAKDDTQTVWGAWGRLVFADEVLASSGFVKQSLDAAVAATSTTQAAAKQMTAQINVVTASTAGTAIGVKLPIAEPGVTITVINASANAITVFPPTGMKIDSLSLNVGMTLGAGAKLAYITTSPTQFYTMTAVYA